MSCSATNTPFYRSRTLRLGDQHATLSWNTQGRWWDWTTSLGTSGSAWTLTGAEEAAHTSLSGTAAPASNSPFTPGGGPDTSLSPAAGELPAQGDTELLSSQTLLDHGTSEAPGGPRRPHSNTRAHDGTPQSGSNPLNSRTGGGGRKPDTPVRQASTP
jgi:hypothetical protein